MANFRIKISVLQKLFNDYNTLTKHGESKPPFRKIDYSLWRTFKEWIISNKYFPNEKDVYITKEENESIIRFSIYSVHSNFRMPANDFTNFLFQQIDDGGDSMTTNTTNTINDQTITYSTSAYNILQSNPFGNATTTTMGYPDNNISITANYANLNSNNKEEEKNMNDKNLNLNFDFGPVTDSNLAVCPFGIAVKNIDGAYVYYDPEKCMVINCTPFTFDTKKFLYKMPVAVSAIAVGDVIIHQTVPMFVKGVEDNEGRIVVIDISVGEEKYILPTRNMFGFDFVTKIVSLMDMKNAGACAENPFGNMLPLMLLMKDDKDLDPMMLLMMSGSNPFGSENMTLFGSQQNPLMLYMLMKDNKNLKDMLPFLMMTSTMPPQR